jgi:tripartite-type tricarboxylate transporter receptor subunit TctC
LKKLVLLAWFLASAALGQAFPGKTVHLISGVTPGSASDTTARILAERLSASLGQPVIVENRLGAGGVVAASYVAKAEPDGHTIIVYTSAFTVAPLLNPGTLDPADLTPVATIGTVPTVLVTSPSKGFKSVADLVAAAKASPGKLIASSAGVGSSTHMNLERFCASAGIEVLHVPFKGVSEALTEVITGRADLYFPPVFSAMPHLREGKLLGLAVGSPRRSALLPDLPTTVEAGYPDSDYNFWIGALVSSRTPRDLVLRLNREFNAAVNAPEVRERFLKIGVDPLSMTLPEFESMLRAEFESNARLIRAAGIKAN